jgi:hypothetical protein
MDESHRPLRLAPGGASSDWDDTLDIDIEEIDLEALAEQIYNLLREELLLERERQGWRPGW